MCLEAGAQAILGVQGRQHLSAGWRSFMYEGGHQSGETFMQLPNQLQETKVGESMVCSRIPVRHASSLPIARLNV